MKRKQSSIAWKGVSGILIVMAIATSYNIMKDRANVDHVIPTTIVIIDGEESYLPHSAVLSVLMSDVWKEVDSAV